MTEEKESKILENKIYYKLENNEFKGFHHLVEAIDDTYIEISKDEFEKLIAINGEVYYSEIDKCLKSSIMPNCSGYVKPIYDKETNVVIETANQDEINENNLKKSIFFYNSELEFASKATTEFNFGLIDDSTYQEVKEYMESINPYFYKKIKTNIINRPKIFDRYVTKL